MCASVEVALKFQRLSPHIKADVPPWSHTHGALRQQIYHFKDGSKCGERRHLRKYSDDMYGFGVGERFTVDSTEYSASTGGIFQSLRVVAEWLLVAWRLRAD